MKRTIQFRTYEENLPQAETFFKDYEAQDIYIAPKNPRNRGILKSRSEMTCRFCGKKQPDTSFKSKPHIISRLFGNNAGISDFECDKCNNHFSKFESNMADFLGVSRSIYSLGKEKVPTFKAPDGSIEARANEIFGNSAIEISAKMPGLITSLTETGKIEMPFKSNPYIPLNVYKCLLKIALTRMPGEEFVNYGLALAFLMKDLNSIQFSVHATQVFLIQVGGEVASPYCILFKKKEPNSNLPSHIFQLYYHDSCLQLHLPYRNGDKQLWEIEEIIMPICPPLIISTEIQEGKSDYEVLNLSSSDKKEGEIRKMSLKFDKDKIQQDIPANTDQGIIGDQKFDPDEAVSILFAKNTPETP